MTAVTPLAELKQVWALSDELFHGHLSEHHALAQPISLRNPFVFYLGHLPAFAWSTIRASLTPSPPPVHDKWDYLFSRGIDPDVDDPTRCHDHPPPPPQWPEWPQVLDYVQTVRDAICELAASRNPPSARVLRLVAEHEAMHVETLYYMLAQSLHTGDASLSASRPASRHPDNIAAQEATLEREVRSPSVEWVHVKAGTVKLGAPTASHFTWDNEANPEIASVAAFRIAKNAVSIADFHAFVCAGGYNNSLLWTPEDWSWVSSTDLLHPSTWTRDGHGSYSVLTGVGPGNPQPKARPLKEVSAWPVSVSLAEARAYATWSGASLPSEAQWVLAAYGPEGASAEFGAVDIMKGEPCEVREDAVVSACGAVGMVGNGWELTTTPFERFEVFQPTPEYLQYSADFFNGKHFVLKGGSWATPSLLVRPSFRNWYQSRYPFVFSKFRLVAATG